MPRKVVLECPFAETTERLHANPASPGRPGSDACRRGGCDRRLARSLPVACLGWGTTCVLITEGLSLFNLLGLQAVGAAWAGVCVVAFTLLTFAWANSRMRSGITWRSLRRARLRPHAALPAIVSAVALAIVDGLVAVAPAPNTWDSMGPASILAANRFDQYFANRPSLENSYERTGQLLAVMRCNQIALDSGPDDWEYPLWVVVEKSGPGLPQVQHTNVRNETRFVQVPPALASSSPCATVRIDSAGATLISTSPPSGIRQLIR